MPPLTLRNFVGDIRCLPGLLVFAGFSGQEKGCWLRFDLFRRLASFQVFVFVLAHWLDGWLAGCPRPNPLFWLANFPVSCCQGAM